MSITQPAASVRRRIPSPLPVALLVVAVFTGVAGCSPLTGSQSTTQPTSGPTSSSERPLGGAPAAPPELLDQDRQAALRIDDGKLPGSVTVFDETYPAITSLDRDLLQALRHAGSRAADDGVELLVTSGWRSQSYQEQLFEQAVAQYGSEAEAARWVARPGTSVHEAGGAVDIGPTKAAAWLAGHGARHGLCQIYANEPWHFELRPDAVDGGCPAMYTDASHDPRLQR